MICPFCNAPRTHVYNSRHTKLASTVWRRRRCQACKKQFTSREYVDISTVLTINDGKQRPYRRSTLLLSLLKACDHAVEQEDVLWNLTEQIERRLAGLASESDQTITKQQIVDTVADTLEIYDQIAYIKYCSYYKPERIRGTKKKV